MFKIQPLTDKIKKENDKLLFLSFIVNYKLIHILNECISKSSAQNLSKYLSDVESCDFIKCLIRWDRHILGVKNWLTINEIWEKLLKNDKSIFLN